MLFEIPERFLEIGVQLLLADAAYDAAARAVPAVTGTTIRDQKKDAIWISMHQPRHRHVRILTARVRHVVRRRPGFLDPRDDLAPDRTIRIIAFDQVEKMWRHRQGELRS